MTPFLKAKLPCLSSTGPRSKLLPATLYRKHKQLMQRLGESAVSFLFYQDSHQIYTVNMLWAFIKIGESKGSSWPVNSKNH